MLDRETFHRLHAAATACDDNVVVRSADVRCLLDAGAELDRQCRAMTQELAAAKTQLVQLADTPREPAPATTA